MHNLSQVRSWKLRKIPLTYFDITFHPHNFSHWNFAGWSKHQIVLSGWNFSLKNSKMLKCRAEWPNKSLCVEPLSLSFLSFISSNFLSEISFNFFVKIYFNLLSKICFDFESPKDFFPNPIQLVLSFAQFSCNLF